MPHNQNELWETPQRMIFFSRIVTSHQVEVSVLCCSIFGRHLFDVSLFDEFIGWVNDVLLSPESFINLQQFVHLLLELNRSDRKRRAG